MSTVLTNLQTPPSWTKVFVELAVRALMRVHLDYLLWSIPQEPDMEPNFAKLTNPAGVAFADEPTVCAAIVQEFIATRLTFGVHIEEDTTGNILAGPRTWRMARERRYPQSDQEVDFHIERIGNQSDNWIPAWIEAKRAFLWTNHLGDFALPKPVDQRKAIRADAKKLADGISVNDGFRSLLVWNVIDPDYPDTAQGPPVILAIV